MSIFLDSKDFQNYIIKLVETPDDYIINGQVYNHQFIPTPMQFCVIGGESTNVPMTNILAQVNDVNYTNLVNKDCVVADLVDPEKFYVLSNGIGRSAALYKFEKKNGSIKLLEKIVGDSDKTAQYYLCHDQNFLYSLLFSHDNVMHYLCRYDLNKNRSDKCSIGNVRPTFIKEDGTSIYVTEQNDSEKISVSKISKATMSKEILYTDPVKDGMGYKHFCAIDGNSFYGILNPKKGEKNYISTIKRYDIDFESFKVEGHELKIDYGKFQNFKIDGDSYSNISFFIHKHGENKYLITVPYNSSGYAMNAEYNYINIFKVKDENNLTLIKRINLYNTFYKAIIPTYNGQCIVCCNKDSVAFFNWNPINEVYERTKQIVEPLKAVAIDKSYNVFIYKENEQLDLFAKSLPIKVEADFEKDEYVYKNKDIESYIYIRAYNFFGKMLSFNYEVILNGPCKFTDTGKKRKEVTTSENDTIKIPITVYEQGSLEINLKEIF